MSTEQFVALFPASVKRKEMKDIIEKAKAAKSSETVFISFDPAVDTNKGQFAGVGTVTAGIYKGRVIDFSILYVGSEWGNIDEWIEKLATSFNLPGARDWEVGSNESPNKVLRCNGLEIEGAIQGGSASIKVRNTEYLKGAEERADAQEKKRRDFKP